MLVKLDHFPKDRGENKQYLAVSKNRGTPKSSILIGISIIFTIHFGESLFLETPIFELPPSRINTFGVASLL